MNIPRSGLIRAAALLFACPWIAGCPSRPPATTDVHASRGRPRETREIVAAINSNAARLDRALWSNNVTVYAELLDEKHGKHAFNLEGTLLYQRPLNLRIDLRPPLGDTVMQVGSNQNEYWAWIEPDLHMMRWGRHRNSGKPCAKKISVHPDQMVFALGLTKLPSAEDGYIGPARKFGKQFDILYYLQRGARDEYSISKEYWVDRSPPFLTRIVNFRDGFGRIVMTAQLKDYKSAPWNGGPLIPRDISIGWPMDEAWFRVRIESLDGKAASQISKTAFNRPEPVRLPASVRDNIIQVDADCDIIH